MTKYVLTYHGALGLPETEAEINELMEAWGAWFGALGDAVVDGGNPFGPAKTVGPDLTVGEEGQGLSGYSILEAASLDAAVEMAKGCPVLAAGGSVCVNETIDM